MAFAFPGGFKDRLTWTCLTITVDVTHSFVSHSDGLVCMEDLQKKFALEFPGKHPIISCNIVLETGVQHKYDSL